MFAQVDRAQPESWKAASTRDPVKTGDALGQKYRVAARDHQNARTELEVLGARRRPRHGHDGIEGVTRNTFGEPDGVESVFLEPIDQRIQARWVVGVAVGAQAESDPHFLQCH